MYTPRKVIEYALFVTRNLKLLRLNMDFHQSHKNSSVSKGNSKRGSNSKQTKEQNFKVNSNYNCVNCKSTSSLNLPGIECDGCRG